MQGHRSHSDVVCQDQSWVRLGHILHDSITNLYIVQPDTRCQYYFVTEPIWYTTTIIIITVDSEPNKKENLLSSFIHAAL